jgi:hypothetical protein
MHSPGTPEGRPRYSGRAHLRRRASLGLAHRMGNHRSRSQPRSLADAHTVDYKYTRQSCSRAATAAPCCDRLPGPTGHLADRATMPVPDHLAGTCHCLRRRGNPQSYHWLEAGGPYQTLPLRAVRLTGARVQPPRRRVGKFVRNHLRLAGAQRQEARTDFDAVTIGTVTTDPRAKAAIQVNNDRFRQIGQGPSLRPARDCDAQPGGSRGSECSFQFEGKRHEWSFSCQLLLRSAS